MRLKKRKRIRGINKRTIVYISMITMLNVAGISYAVWNQDLALDATYTTGSIETFFQDCEDEGFHVTIDDDRIFISKELESSTGLDKTLSFEVTNNGTVSSKCMNIIPIQGKNANSEITISGIRNDVVSPNGTESGEIVIDITTGGAYTFGYELEFANK